MALIYAIMTSASSMYVSLVADWRSELIAVGFIGILAVALDYMHNVLNCFFMLKQAVALIGFILFFVVFWVSLK